MAKSKQTVRWEGSSLAEMVEQLYNIELPISTVKNSPCIAPTFRRELKTEWNMRLKKMLENEGIEVLEVDGTLVAIIENDIEGYFAIEVNSKVKNLDWEATE